MGIKENLSVVKKEIEDAARACGRNPAEIRLIAVSKTKPASMVMEAYESGMRDFGENRVQELVEKYDEVPKDVRWHLIGHLQKNKVKYLLEKTELIHSLDSIDLAKEIQKRASAAGKVQNVLIQVNVTGEESKFGVPKERLTDFCEAVSQFENICVKGLMTISVRDYTEAQNRAVFEELHRLFDEVKAKGLKNFSMQELSMGMTHDFPAAVAAGATMIRIGTAIFGERQYPAAE